MEEVLRFRLASPARIGGKHLPFEQAEIPPLLQRAGQGLYVRQGVRTAEGDGGPLLRADPFAGQLFVVGDRKPRSESRLAVVRRRLYRTGVDRNLAHADLFRRREPRARLRERLSGVRLHGVDDRTDGPQTLLPDRPHRGLAARLGRLQGQLSGDLHRAAALPPHCQLRGDAVARPHLRGAFPESRVRRAGAHIARLLDADAGDDRRAGAHAGFGQQSLRFGRYLRADVQFADVPAGRRARGVRRSAVFELLRPDFPARETRRAREDHSFGKCGLS